jgi:tetratricopeptide (TPR) repeat protein
MIASVGIYELLENMNNKERIRFIVPAHIVLPLLLLLMNYKENNHSDDYLVPEYTRVMGDNLEKNAIIISAQWDYWCSAFWYKQMIEGYRPDVVLVEKELLRRTWYPHQLMKWYPEVIGKSKTELDAYMNNLELFESGKGFDQAAIQRDYMEFLHSIVEKNIDNRPIYITPDLNQATQDNFYGEYIQVPQGLAIRLLREDKYIAPDFSKLKFDKFIASIKGRDDHLEKGIQQNVANFMAFTGAYCYNKFNVEEAKKLYELALAIDPKNQMAIQGKNAIKEMN